MVIVAAAYSWSFLEICLLAKLILKHRSKGAILGSTLLDFLGGAG